MFFTALLIRQKHLYQPALAIFAALALFPGSAHAMPDLVLAGAGNAQAAIYVSPEIMSAAPTNRLRASVEDLAGCLRTMSGAEIPVLTNKPASDDCRVPILIGEYAEAVFGKPKKESPGEQGWRLVVSAKGVGLIGQTELATSYAIYELLDRFGCRWFTPGPLGEELPVLPTISMPEMDISETPATLARGFACADEDFARRNRFYLHYKNDKPFLPTDATNIMPEPFQCSAHSLMNTNCPGSVSFQQTTNNAIQTNSIRIWRELAFNPGEPTAPLPLMRKWSDDIPVALTNSLSAWLPVAPCFFAGSTPGLYLGIRLAWYPRARPKDVLDEFFNRFYGAAAPAMSEFWDCLDQAWYETPEHSANAWGYLRRFTPGVMSRARRALDTASSTAANDKERNRVAAAGAMFSQFELFMRMRQDLAEGRFENLAKYADAWLAAWPEIQSNQTFSCLFGTQDTGKNFQQFLLNTYKEASRIAANFTVIKPPLRLWHWAVETNETGESLGWPGAEFNDSAWAIADSCLDTWPAIGLWNQPATVWYRARVGALQPPKGNKMFLWLSAVQGETRAYINGHPIQPLPAHDGNSESPIRAMTFDITTHISENQTNLLAVAVSCLAPTEPGAAGLLGPACLCHEKKPDP